MSDYELHPITGEYADLTEPEVNALRASLRETGQCVPIVIWKNQIVDGRHRAKLCGELRINPLYKDITKVCSTEEQMRRYVAGLNEHRRSRTTPLTAEEKRAKAAAAIEANPERSDVAIAEDLGDVSRPTVHRVRKKLEETGVVPRTTPAERKSRTGKVGEGARKMASAARKMPSVDQPKPPEPRDYCLQQVRNLILNESLPQIPQAQWVEFVRELFEEIEDIKAVIEKRTGPIKIKMRDAPPIAVKPDQEIRAKTNTAAYIEMEDIPTFLDRRLWAANELGKAAD
jgi:ParB-like chromosome segregation protein Spo0J